MSSLRQFLPALLCSGFFALYPALAPAQIYRWVDEDGNVQFGDRPRDPQQAAAAAPVELQESYRPPERSEEEMRAYQDGLQRQRDRADERYREQQEQLAEARAERESERAERCEQLGNRVRRLGTMQVEQGRRTVYYAVEDGSAVTAQRQREIVNQLQAEMRELGCP